MKSKKDILSWLKDKRNIYFLIILVFAIGIRFIFFLQTTDQTLWWDEADYMLMAKDMAHSIEYNYDPVRPILFSLVNGLIFKIAGYTEIIPRLILLILSIFTVVYTYLLAKKIYNEEIGLISAALMAIAPHVLFFTLRVLVDLPSLAFFTISAYYF